MNRQKTGALSEGLKTNKIHSKNPTPLWAAYTNFNREKSIDILEYNRIIYQRPTIYFKYSREFKSKWRNQKSKQKLSKNDHL
jgi:hypothetical protein